MLPLIKNKKLFLVIIVIELVTIFLLIKKTINRESILGESISINPIYKEDINLFQAGNLRHFYEPVANSSPNRTAGFVGYQPVYTINADSLNERYDYPIEKSPDTFRIIVLGDSYTYGLYVNTVDNYVEKLEDLLNQNNSCPIKKKFEVINLGMEGYDIEYSVERFKRRGQKYNPDLVMWFLKSDDYEQIADLIYTDAMKHKKDLEKRGIMGNLDKDGNYFSAFQLATDDLLKKYSENFIYQYQKRGLEQINDSFHGPLLIYSFHDINKNLRKLIKQFVVDRKMTYYTDKLTDIKLTNGATFADHHPSVKGHALIANFLYNYLFESKLIPCN